MTGSCQIRKGVKVSQNGTSPFSIHYLVSFLQLVLMTILSSFMFPKPIFQRTMHVASQNYDVINLIYKVIGVTTDMASSISTIQ